MKKRVFVIVVCLLAVAGNLVAQQGSPKKLLQFTGIIYNADTNAVVPYVTVTNISHNNQKYAANHQGYFSFVAHEGDTVHLKTIGYKEQYVVIPRTKENKYTAMIKMIPEAINLPELVIHPLPWASIDEFNRDFMSLKIADDEISLAQKNLSHESLMAMAKVAPRSAEEMQTFTSLQNHIQMTNKTINQRYANPLLSPFAWGNLINQIIQGNESRKEN